MIHKIDSAESNLKPKSFCLINNENENPKKKFFRDNKLRFLGKPF